MRDQFDNPWKTLPTQPTGIESIDSRFARIRELRKQKQEAKTQAARLRNVYRIFLSDGPAALRASGWDGTVDGFELERLANHAADRVDELEQEEIEAGIEAREYIKEHADELRAEANRLYEESGCDQFVEAAADALKEALAKQDRQRGILLLIESAASNSEKVGYRSRSLVIDGTPVEQVIDTIVDTALTRNAEPSLIRRDGLRLRRINWDVDDVPAHVPDSAVFESRHGWHDEKGRRIADKSAAGVIVEGVRGSY